MKAAIYPGGGGAITIETIPDPEPGPGDVVIKVHRCGICGTDLSMTKGEIWDYGAGQFGHEYAGEIVAVGKDVTTLKVGGKISVLPSGACGHCQSCRTGANHILCSNAAGAMTGFAEYARLASNIAIPLPDTLSLTDGALIEPLAVSLYGVRQSLMMTGDKVLVLGGGTVALYAIYWARRLGAGRIVAASRSDRRKDLCLAMGADAFVTFGENETGEVIEALGGPADVVYECVGVEGMLTRSVMHARQYGKVVSLGFCTHPDPLMPAMASYKCVSMQFLVGYTLRDFHYIANHLDAGHVDPKRIVTNEIALMDLPAMMDRLRGPNRETKVHVLT
ncbi:alcohol dehydrogenase catalytic domain-containing protein [Novosphingobium album (ex Liu et al. 2023)]|uniref:Alcohol dehydrogenase catalytic domain-containing protein n=1 Tax=Novosphingobium album (ex Liu et al. 2023) TaxID=3031130 RepID=A0ABT5WQT2_9SPHN|nr:alcohol dehydrogenase catalytic domain-containing protein [Novosphingobium album (ex Liu et al. 2023)]MDE8652403.1 alcohol dehydrogenase catalytic domain-containing protein [Novosphingobium album (ex Liu et al. 2023)]